MFPMSCVITKKHPFIGILPNDNDLKNRPGRVIERSRSLILRLSKKHPSYALLVEARRRIELLKGAWAPSG